MDQRVIPAVEPASPPVDRKQAILRAAVRLFAQRGYHAVSIRQIADAAGVPLALVGYYYGPKQALFEAIFAHWNPTVQERLAALDAAVAGGGPALLRHIVEAFVQPVLRLRASAEGEFYALLVARELLHHSEEADQVLRKIFDPLALAFIDALMTALPAASRAQVAWCYQFALGALLHHLSDHRVGRLSQGEARPGDPAAAGLLVEFIVAGLEQAVRQATATPAASASPPIAPSPLRKPRRPAA